mmetsp:Transcript_17161/g.43674  ORF Transcript_17161/g.43674 Transcript_17161/m.43674 type:complete len:220 (+) Transcript_17161:277-936(+)
MQSWVSGGVSMRGIVDALQLQPPMSAQQMPALRQQVPHHRASRAYHRSNCRRGQRLQKTCRPQIMTGHFRKNGMSGRADATPSLRMAPRLLTSGKCRCQCGGLAATHCCRAQAPLWRLARQAPQENMWQALAVSFGMLQHQQSQTSPGLSRLPGAGKHRCGRQRLVQMLTARGLTCGSRAGTRTLLGAYGFFRGRRTEEDCSTPRAAMSPWHRPTSTIA